MSPPSQSWLAITVHVAGEGLGGGTGEGEGGVGDGGVGVGGVGVGGGGVGDGVGPPPEMEMSTQLTKMLSSYDGSPCQNHERVQWSQLMSSGIFIWAT